MTIFTTDIVESVDTAVPDALDAPQSTGDLEITIAAEFVGDSGNPVDPEGASEVVAHEDGLLYVTNSANARIDIFDIAGNALTGTIPLIDLPGFDGVQSVAVKNGLIAVAISRAPVDVELFGETKPVAQPGFVALYDAATLTLQKTVDVGNLPDMLTFTPDGSKLLVAGEGEFNQDSIDAGIASNPLGTVAIIDLSEFGAVTLPDPVFETADLTVTGKADALILDHSPAMDIAEGTISFSLVLDDVAGRQAFVAKEAGGLNAGNITIFADDGVVKLGIESATQKIRLDGGQLVAGEEQTIAVSFGTDGLKLYVNGALVAANGFTGGIGGNTEPLVLGAAQWESSVGTTDKMQAPMKGDLLDFAIYGAPLTDDQIAALASDEAGSGEITVDILDGTPLNGFEDAARAAGIRLQEGVDFAEDIEPEYIAVSADGKTAFVALQENNAIAKIDLETNTAIDLFGLGVTDFSQTKLDALDDGTIDIRNFDHLVGFRMPDAITTAEIGGQTYLLTANEGDSRDFDEARVFDLAQAGRLDPTVQQDLIDKGQLDLGNAAVGLGRLEVSTLDGDTDGDGDIDVIHAFSSRSFSIFDADGTLVFDSGSEFEEILAEIAPERFNDDDGTGAENRSVAKGPEPEAIITGEVDGTLYAFIGLERDSGIMIYNIDDPANAFFVDYIPPLHVGNAGAGDVARHGPETIAFIPASESTSGKAQIAVAYEVSGTTFVYDIGTPAVEPPAPSVKINEVLMSTTGADVEYVELFGTPGTSLDGLSLVAFNANASEAGDLNLQIDFGAGDVLGDNGFLLIGNDLVSTAYGVNPDIAISENSFENDSEIFALVQTDTLVVTDGTVVDDPGTQIVDSVGFINGDLDFVDFFGVPVVGPDGSFLPAGGRRIVDGVDTDTAADWAIADFGLGPDNTPTAGFDTGTPSLDLTIMEIQGAGHVSAYVDQIVTTSGIVTAVDFNGYYLQDAAGDGDDATSDGIFVFVGNGNASGINVGDAVTVTGSVSEFIPGGAGSGNLSTTQITDFGASTTTVISSGNALPDAVVLGAAGRTPPTEIVISDDELPVNLQDVPGDFNPETDGIDFYESLEGMRVTVDNPVAISPTNRFDETWVVTDDGAGTTPGLNSRGALELNADIDGYGDLNPERIQLQYDAFFDLLPDDFTPPEITLGDNLSDVTGVVSYSFGNFEVLVTEAFAIETASPLAQEVTTIAAGEGELTIATYNVLNVSGAPEANDGDQIAAIAAQIANNLGAPDIIALQEIQDNNGSEGGATDDGVLDADETLQAIVDAIEAAGGPVYRFQSAEVDVFGETGGVPGGNIRNAFLYNPDRVDAVDFQTLEVAELTAFGVTDPLAFEGTRDPLLGTFAFNGEEITLINNHLSSRFGSDPVFGGPQPFEQGGEAARELQTKTLNEVVDALLAADEDANVVVLGDLNTFEFTDELSEDLPGIGTERVLTNLSATAVDGYTFNFQGNAQALDHIFVTDGLLNGAQVDVVHTNVDFVDGVSDHEPIVASFQFPVPGEVITGTNRRDVLVGTEGDDEISGLQSADDISALGGDDLVLGGRGPDTIFGGEGDDRLFGNNGPDLILGDAGNDTIGGGNGPDRINGGAGDDRLTGGAGPDVFEFEGSFGNDTITDLQGIDDVEFVDADITDIAVSVTTEGLLVTVSSPVIEGTVLFEGITAPEDLF